VVTLESAGDTTSCPVIELSESIVTFEDPVFVESDCKLAETVTVGGLGTEAGAL
jgi:hypothetical protein